MAGHPRAYATPEEMQTAIESYFQKCKDDDIKLTITGLAYYLGFESRQSIYDYKELGEYSYIIKRASLAVEMGYEQALFGTTVAGPIFALKNMGWKDKTEVDKTIRGGIAVNYNYQEGNAPLLDEGD